MNFTQKWTLLLILYNIGKSLPCYKNDKANPKNIAGFKRDKKGPLNNQWSTSYTLYKFQDIPHKEAWITLIWMQFDCGYVTSFMDDPP